MVFFRAASKIISPTQKIGFFFLCLVGVILASADALAWVKGSGNVITQTRQIQGFTGIVLRGAGVLIVEQTGQDSLSITAEDNVLPLLQSHLEGAWLVIEPKSNVFVQPTAGITYHVTVRSLDYVAAWGSTHVSVENIHTPSLKVKLNGASDGRLLGHSSRQELMLSGSGTLDASGLQGDEARVVSDGSGNVTVNASRSLTARINGSGDVRYLGSPVVTAEVHGSGAVRSISIKGPASTK